MTFVVKRKDGTIVPEGAELVDSRGESWIMGPCTHPRKLFVYWDEDPEGEPFYPNRTNREFYASVFGLGIWDNVAMDWSFAP